MNPDMPVYPDPIERVITLLKSHFGGTFKAYYEGDPMDIPKANLPCIIVQKEATKITANNAPTGHDAILEQLAVRVVFNKLDDSGLTDSYDLTERKLRRIVEARDPQTRQFIANTIMHVLRTNISFSGASRNQDVDIEYGIVPRTEELLTSEAKIQIIVDSIVPIVR